MLRCCSTVGMEYRHSKAQISIHGLYGTVHLLIVHQIQHVIVLYAPKSLLHRLKNNLSQEDTWHDNCVWWRAVVCWKLVQHGRAASAAFHFKAKGADGPLYSPKLFERVDLWPHHPHPDHVPLCVLSSAQTSNPCSRALSFKVPNMYRLPNSSAEHRDYIGPL